MSVATTRSTSSYHHRNEAYDSHHLRHQAHKGSSKLTLSDSSEGVEHLSEGGLRQVGAEARNTPSEERRLRARRAMTSHAPRRTYSDSKTSPKETYVKEPRVEVREVRRKSDSERRHHRRKSEKEDERGGQRVYVHKAHRKSEGEADRSRPGTLLRSTTNAGEASRTRHERQRTGDRELLRRHSERRSSHPDDRSHTPLRREKRSIADYAPKSTRDRIPVTR